MTLRVNRKPGATARRMILTLPLTLVLAGCGQPEDVRLDEDGTMAVEPGAAMDTTPAGTPAPPSPATIADDQERTVSVRLLEWAVQPSRDTVSAGEITFQVMNTGTMHHALEVEGKGVEQETDHIAPGATATLIVRLGPGTYELYCPIVDQRDHKTQGMVAELVVRPDKPTLMAPPGSD